ncbi:hypothetical protein [Flavobacterium pedocola]
MGQRANYILKDGNQLTIHYNHWRANCIAPDLYLGEKKFLEFVQECQLDDEIIDEPWIEGCVIIDQTNKALHFWSFEFSRDTSVIEYYLNQLSKKWSGWKLNILKNRMYDAEQVLGIDYISKQEFKPIDRASKEEILVDKPVDWCTTSVIIKEELSLFITMIGNFNLEKIISYGQEIIPEIKNKKNYDLPKEGENGSYQCIVIDQEKRKVFITESSLGLSESCKDFWSDYDLVFGDFGYIEALRLAGIDTSELLLPKEEIEAQFAEMVQNDDNFNPFELAEFIKQENTDVEFNPAFFDNVKPKKSLVDKLKIGFKKVFGQK